MRAVILSREAILQLKARGVDCDYDDDLLIFQTLCDFALFGFDKAMEEERAKLNAGD
jgi:hypothetical protein